MEDSPYRSWVEVDLDGFVKNLSEIRRLVGPGVKIMQVVKADAYGHGAMEIANVALKNGASCLGVANADEGTQLRISGIGAPIVILSPSLPSEAEEILKYNLIPSISDLAFARRFQEVCRRAGVTAPIQIEVDTGMGRAGVPHREAAAFIRELKGLSSLTIEGIFSHLAVSETLNEFNLIQRDNLVCLLEDLAQAGIRIPVRHLANSGAVLNYPEFHLDLVRPGIMSYGIFPSPETLSRASLEPVMTFKTRVLLVKEFPPGHSIGYGKSYTTGRRTKIATIPVGYGDGYGFVLSNQGEVLIGGRRLPIVGRISMDLSTVDVTDLPRCEPGDEAVLLGRQGGEYISANEIAGRTNTISYEVLCAIGKRAPRVFLRKGEVDAVEPQLRRIFIPDQERSLARIDNMIRRCLHARARSEEMGDAIYYEMFETLFGKGNRRLELRSDFRYEIVVSKLSERDDPGERPGELLQMTTHIEYRKVLKNHVFMIGCAGNNDQLAALFEDEKCQYRWLLNQEERLIPERDFRVASVKAGGWPVAIIETRNTARGYEVWCGGEELKEKINTPLLMELEIVTKKARGSRNFSVYIAYPTRGLEINFSYGAADLGLVREFCFFAGRRPYPEIRRSRESIKIKIPKEDWVFPVSGATFVWDI